MRDVRVAEGPVWTPYNGKHVAPKGVSWEKIVESTKKDPAKYVPGTNVRELELKVFENGTPVTNGKPWKVMEFKHVIGASEGKPSMWVRVESTANTIHGHPISLREFKKLTK